MPSRLALFFLLIAVVSASSDLTCENVREAVDKCQFVRDHCQEDRLGYFDYLQVYYCAKSSVAGGFFLSAVVLWLVVLFVVIGIAASDYLCPNLNTISKMLGLSESLAGVTFLALGNGSPDVFSTYAAMKIGSGSLAIGELIGAASFITAVVTGSMAIIRPFKVARKSFLRDVIFFTVAVAFAMYCVSDGVLATWECAAMLAIYVLYVMFVVAWHWYNSRRRHSYLVETRARDLYTELGHETAIEADEEITDRPSLLTQGLNFNGLTSPPISPLTVTNNPTQPTVTSPVSPLTQFPMWQETSEEEQEEAFSELTRIMRLRKIQQRSPNFHVDSQINNNHTSSSPGAPIRPSLFRAMEFRQVLQQLSDGRNSFALSIPLQQTSSSEDIPRLATSDPHIDVPKDAQRLRFASAPEIIEAPSPAPSRPIPSVIITDVDDQTHEPEAYNPADYERSTSPNVDRYSDDPDAPFLPDVELHQFSPHRLLSPNREGLTKLFDHITPVMGSWSSAITTVCPSLIGFQSMSWGDKIMCIFTAPAVLLLTVTVPVIEFDAMEKEAQLSEGTSDYFSSSIKSKVFIPIVRWLLVIQALLGPIFVLWTGFGDGDTSLLVLTLYALSASSVMLVLIFFLVPEATRAPIYMQSLSFVGFIIAISWVSVVANEVVGILKALGLVFNISDAILGLTVFAVGNSLGDLIANTTVAKMGFPMMALSACFGGPMLNILVGVGVSGLLVMPHGGFHIQLSHTLVISGVTLLVTLLFLLISVPLNNWRMSRTLGIITVLFWVVATTVNVILEITVS